jgi:aminomethyltransferase
MDVIGLAEGRQRYAFFTNDAGGLLDDLMIARHAEGLHLVVNAACAPPISPIWSIICRLFTC